MESIEDIIQNKLFPALFELKEGDPACFTTDDIAYAIAKSKEQLQFYDFNSGAYSTKLQNKETMKAFVSNDFAGFVIDRTVYPNRMIGVNDKTTNVIIPLEKNRIFLKNLFNLDKVVEDICPQNYAIARSVVANFIYQNQVDSTGLRINRKNILLAIASYDSLKSPVINENHNIHNAIFFIDILCMRSYSSFIDDVSAEKFKEPMSSPSASNVSAWLIYNFLKTGDQSLAFKKMQSQIIKDCSAKPIQIAEYLKVLPSVGIGSFGYDGELMFSLHHSIGLNTTSSEIKDAVNKLSSLLLHTPVLKAYQSMMFSLMRENDMFFTLNSQQKIEVAPTLLQVLNQNFDVNNNLTLLKCDTLSKLLEKSNSFSFKLDKYYTPETINYILRNLTVEDKHKNGIVDALKKQNKKELSESLDCVHLEDISNKFVQELYALSYAQKKSDSTPVEDSLFCEALQDSFFKQLDKELIFTMISSISEIENKENGLLDKLQNFPDWVSEKTEFDILMNSVIFNSSVDSKLRAYFAEKYPENYRNVIYTFQDFKEKNPNKLKLRSGNVFDSSALMENKKVSFLWKGEEVKFKIPVISYGMKNEEINKVRLQDTINATVSGSKKSAPDEDLSSQSFKL